MSSFELKVLRLVLAGNSPEKIASATGRKDQDVQQMFESAVVKLAAAGKSKSKRST